MWIASSFLEKHFKAKRTSLSAWKQNLSSTELGYIPRTLSKQNADKEARKNIRLEMTNVSVYWREGYLACSLFWLLVCQRHLCFSIQPWCNPLCLTGLKLTKLVLNLFEFLGNSRCWCALCFVSTFNWVTDLTWEVWGILTKHSVWSINANRYGMS